MLLIQTMYSLINDLSFLSILKTFLYEYTVLENECVDINISYMQVTNKFSINTLVVSLCYSTTPNRMMAHPGQFWLYLNV